MNNVKSKSKSKSKSKWSKYAFGPTKSLTQKVNNLAKQVRKDAPELKFWTTIAPPDVNLYKANTFTYNICAIPRDTSSMGRIGSKVKLQNVSGQFYTLAGGTALIRMIIAVDKTPQLGNLSYTDVFDNLDVIANYNMDNSKRYRILKNIIYTTDVYSPNKYHKFSVSLKDLPQEYTIADIAESNSIRIILQSSTTNPAIGQPFYFVTKVTYTDA